MLAVWIIDTRVILTGLSKIILTGTSVILTGVSIIFGVVVLETCPEVVVLETCPGVVVLETCPVVLETCPWVVVGSLFGAGVDIFETGAEQMEINSTAESWAFLHLPNVFWQVFFFEFTSTDSFVALHLIISDLNRRQISRNV